MNGDGLDVTDDDLRQLARGKGPVSTYARIALNARRGTGTLVSFHEALAMVTGDVAIKHALETGAQELEDAREQG